MSSRRARIAFALAAALLTAAGGMIAAPRPAQAAVTVDISVFHDSLAPYGTWIDDPVYGQVWRPAGMAPGWRPYTEGRWAYTDDYGWIWVSDEPWGWAPYHYGRWLLEPGVGWVWVPGSVWAPAWVVWRLGAGYIGWVPLPPETMPGYAPPPVAPDGWCFVPARSFEDPRIARVIMPPARNTVLISNTVNVTNYQVINQRIVNRSIPVTTIQEATRRPVMRYHTSFADVSRQASPHPIEGNRLTLYQPKPLRHQSPAALPPAMRAQVVRPPEPARRPGQPRTEAPRVAPSQRPAEPAPTLRPRAVTPEQQYRQAPAERRTVPASPHQPVYRPAQPAVPHQAPYHPARPAPPVPTRRPQEIRPQEVRPQEVRPPVVRPQRVPAPAARIPAPVHSAPQAPGCKPGEGSCGGARPEPHR